MVEVSINKWSADIGKFIKQYMEGIRAMQYEYHTNGSSHEYLSLKRTLEEARHSLITTINNIEQTNFLPQEE